MKHSILVIAFAVVCSNLNAQNVGINNTDPQFSLDVNGRARIRHIDGSNTAGIWFNRSDNEAESFIGHLNDTLFGVYTFHHGGYKFLFDQINGNLQMPQSGAGVVLGNLDRPLITRGFDAFLTGANKGIGRWGLFMEPSTITVGMPNISGKSFAVSAYNDNSTVNKTMLLVRQDGNIGINQPLPAARLDVNGTVKITDGTQGDGKFLMSDAAGNASWHKLPTVVSIPASAFFPETSGTYSHADFQATGSGNVPLIAPVTLPDNTMLDSMQVYFYDNSTVDDLTFTLRALGRIDNNFGNFQSFTTSGTSTVNRRGSVTAPNANLNNRLYSFDIVATPGFGGNWANLAIKTVIIFYHYL